MGMRLDFVTDIVLQTGQSLCMLGLFAEGQPKGSENDKNTLYFFAEKFGSLRKNAYLCSVFLRVVKRWPNEASVMTGS